MAKKSPVKKAVRPVPRGYRTVTPYLNQTDCAALIAFCKKAFGAKLLAKMAGPGGKLMHAEIKIGDSIVMMSDAVQEPARVSGLFLYIENVDKTFARALKAGAKVLTALQDTPWGDRYGRVVDPLGNSWALGTHVENVRPAELKKRMKAAMKKKPAG